MGVHVGMDITQENLCVKTHQKLLPWSRPCKIEWSMSTDIELIVISVLPSKCMSGVVIVTEMKTIHVSPKH